MKKNNNTGDDDLFVLAMELRVTAAAVFGPATSRRNLLSSASKLWLFTVVIHVEKSITFLI